MDNNIEGSSNLSSSSSDDDNYAESFGARQQLIAQRRDGLGRIGLSSLQKITTAFRILAYGAPANDTDEYIKIGESTTIESVKRFCRAVVEVFGGQYLRSPNAHDVARLLHIGELRGFPGSNNDINELESSHLFANLATGITIPARYVIQGKEYNMGYYLADDECNLNAPIVELFEVPTPDVEPAIDDGSRFEEFLARYRQIKNKEAHIALRNALIEHLWEQYSNSES
ncbi:uncharacterized protein LOC122023251 [Zingiber officinale]|uniref:uncharacterized protein LOC122023251 n=1 Tax=Zingiber officinale TaxID=94328 RepID=UPI001C4AD8F2|nr:uncharacterized protein LOC122023251 [Zingiber officinale]